MKEITVQYVQEKYLFRVISRLQTDMEKVESKIVWSCTKLGLLTGAALGILICFFANFDGVLALFLKWIGTILLSAILVGVGGFVLGWTLAYKYCLAKFGKLSSDIALYSMAEKYIRANDFSKYNKKLKKICNNKVNELDSKTIAMDFIGRLYFGLQNDIDNAIRIIIALGILAGIAIGIVAGIVAGEYIAHEINAAVIIVLAVVGGIAGFFFARSYAEEYCIRVFGKRANDISVYKMATHYSMTGSKISTQSQTIASEPIGISKTEFTELPQT